MAETQAIIPDRDFHVTTVDGATYEVTSRYIGEIAFLDLLKQMLKRDLERQDEDYNHPKYPEWSKTTVLQILHNREYLGHLICGRQTTKSFKNKKMVIVPEEQWVVTPNTHEPLVEQYVFDLAQKTAHVKKRENSWAHVNIFAGLLKCPDCGSGLGFRILFPRQSNS